MAKRQPKSREIIADNLKKRGWSLGYVSAIDSNGRTIWIADAHRGDGKRFVVRADKKLTAFVNSNQRFEMAPSDGVVLATDEAAGSGEASASALAWVGSSAWAWGLL
jgi:hypothetical protein